MKRTIFNLDQPLSRENLKSWISSRIAIYMAAMIAILAFLSAAQIGFRLTHFGSTFILW
jgi:hypothetical protein